MCYYVGRFLGLLGFLDSPSLPLSMISPCLSFFPLFPFFWLSLSSVSSHFYRLLSLLLTTFSLTVHRNFYAHDFDIFHDGVSTLCMSLF